MKRPKINEKEAGVGPFKKANKFATLLPIFIVFVYVINGTTYQSLLNHFLFQLVLPDYKDKETLMKKLTIAISNAEGFGLE